MVYGGNKLKPLFFAAVLLMAIPLCGFSQTDTTRQKENNIDKTMTLKQDKAESDTTSNDKEAHSPKKATYYSMALPGLGQAYNKKYWKIPVIYAGFGTLVYFINSNNNEYNKFLDAYAYVLEEQEGPPPNAMVERYDGNLDKLRTIKDYYRRNLELSYILSGALYILQVLDATVDAHFVDFDVTDDISLQIRPYLETERNRPAIAAKGITLRFKL